MELYVGLDVSLAADASRRPAAAAIKAPSRPMSWRRVSLPFSNDATKLPMS